MKAHIGCGSVYLDEWVNIDLNLSHVFLASDRPDLVEKYRTTEDDYYGRHRDVTRDRLRSGPVCKEVVCDMFGDFTDLPDLQVDEILARQCFEHLSITEAHRALDSARTRLKSGGILRLDVPDHDATLALIQATADPLYVRHLLGPRNSPYGYHMMSYTRDGLRRLVEEHGFRFVNEEPNIHMYPAFCLRFQRA